MDVRETVDAIVREITSVVSQTDASHGMALVEAVLKADRVFVFGEGRSGLVARAFAMRLMQVGLEAYVVGETTTPAVREGDLFIGVSGSGETASTVLFAGNAHKAGGRVAAIVASPDTSLGRIADSVIVIPGRARTGVGVESMQMPGSLFEQAAFMFLDAMIVILVQKRGSSYQAMFKRHANL